MTYLEMMGQRFNRESTQKHDRNIAKLRSLNVPQDVIDTYRVEQGITAASRRQYEAARGGIENNRLSPPPLARVGRGLQDLPTGFGQITGTLPQTQALMSLFPGGESASNFGKLWSQTDEQAEASELQDVTRYEAGVGDDIDWWRLGGQAAATLPASLVGTVPAGLGWMARGALGAAGAGTAGGLLYAKKPMDRYVNTAIGVATGGPMGIAADPLMRTAGAGLRAGASGVGRGARAVSDAAKDLYSNLEIPNISGSGQLGRGYVHPAQRAANEFRFDPEVPEAIRSRVRELAEEAFRNNLPFNAAAAARKLQAEGFGFEGATGMSTGQAYRDPIIYGAEENLAKRAGGEQLANQRIGQNAQAEGWVDDLLKSDLTDIDYAKQITETVQKADSAMRKVVKQAYDAIPGGGKFSRDGLANRTQQIMDDHRTKIDAVVKERISELIDPKSMRAFTFEELDGLNKLISDNMPLGIDGGINMAAGKLKTAIMGVFDDAASLAPEGQKAAYIAARDAARKRFEMIGKNNTVVARMVHDLLDPTKVRSKIFGEIGDLERLKKFIPEDQWVNVQEITLQALQEATTGKGGFSQAGYNGFIKKLKKNRLEIIFGKEKTAELMGFGQTTRDLFRAPNMSNINRSGTASEAEKIALNAFEALMDFVPGGRGVAQVIQKGSEVRVANAQARATQRAVDEALSGQPLPPRVINPMDRRIPGTSMTGSQAVQLLNAPAGLLGVETQRPRGRLVVD